MNIEELLKEGPSLTLTPEKEPELPVEEKKPEPKVYEEEQYLTDEEKKQVDAFVEQIDLENSTSILQYGAGTQKKMSDFSEGTLEKVRSKDLGEVGDLLNGVVTELKGFDKQTMSLPEYKELKIALKVNENTLNNEKIATNRVKLQDDLFDVNKENNLDECSVYVKRFDLKIEKNIVNVIVENNEGQKIINKKSDEEILKVDIPKNEIENTKLKIKYEIKVTNIGEIDGYATEITDYLPEGFEVMSTQTTQWVVDGNKVKTNSLNRNLLQPGESKSVFIECTYKVNKENIGSKINSVKITEYENNSDSKDITEDNEDNEEMVITVKTGVATICFIIIIGILLISIIVTLILKKRK